jgi:deazaflavin-dependent oxidoreductase (nitroreductase family)
MTPGQIVGAHAADECIDLSTTGRRSGDVHRIEIWFGVIDGVVYLVSGNGPGADWYRNALASPVVTVHVAGHDLAGTARDVTDPAERRRAGELMGAKYPAWEGDESIGLTRHAWCYEVPLLAIELPSGETVPE